MSQRPAKAECWSTVSACTPSRTRLGCPASNTERISEIRWRAAKACRRLHSPSLEFCLGIWMAIGYVERN